MHPAPFRAQALAGGLDLDPDLPEPWDPDEGLCGLHVLRHVERFLDSLGMTLVLNTSRCCDLDDQLVSDYPYDDGAAALRRYRQVTSHSGLQRVLRDEPLSVPLLQMSGTQCLGWRHISWEGMRLDRIFRPGQLFLLWPQMFPQMPRGPQRTELHLFAWQAPFPSHSLVTWTNGAQLCDGPQPIELRLQQAAGFILRHPEPIQRSIHGGWSRVERWWSDAVATAHADPPN
jgi:hypothetical protein